MSLPLRQQRNEAEHLWQPCRVCGEEKPLSEYHRDAEYRNGHKSECKACASARVKRRNIEHPEIRQAYREKNRQKLIEYHRRLRREQPEKVRATETRYRNSEKGKAVQRRAERRQRERYPERIRARAAVNNAIQAGKLTRGPCEMCGGKPAEAHHQDYSRPLDVRWLCRPHHREADGRAATG